MQIYMQMHYVNLPALLYSLDSQGFVLNLWTHAQFVSKNIFIICPYMQRLLENKPSM